MDWESGFPDGSPDLDPAMEPSFSLNMDSDVATCSDSGNEITECKCGVNGYSPRNCHLYYGISSLHSQTVETVSWARKGNGVLKFYADGRELGLGDQVPSGKYASNRCELGTIPYRYDAGDDVYYTASFYLPSEYWDTVTKYSVILTQWKIVDDPHGALRLSNYGDYKLYYAGAFGAEPDATDDGTYIGQATPDAWNDVKLYYKKSLGSDGQFRVYLNGVKVFERANQKNMIGRRDDGSGGYVKFGMYTEIRSERVVYFDAVSMSTFLPDEFATEAEWVAEHVHLPSATLTAPTDEAAVASGGAISLAANAVDPAGNKLGSAGGIAKVEWFVRQADVECKIAEISSAPFSATWTPAEDGAYTVFARATDTDDNVATTTDAIVYVGNRPPSVIVTSPAAGAILDVGAQTPVRISATDPDGTVAKVEVFIFAAESSSSTATSVGTDTSAAAEGVFEVSWTPPAKGAYVLYAVATDAAGKTAESVHVGVVPGAVTTDLSLKATDDAALKGKTANRNENNNYGGVELYTREPDDNDGEQSIVSIFKFDTSDLDNFKEIREAKLRLRVSNILDNQDAANISAWSTTGSTNWDEESVTWNNGPRKADILDVTIVTASEAWYEWDLTTYVDAAVKEENLGSSTTFWMEGYMEGRTDGWTGTKIGMDFDSHKRATFPQLRVVGSDTPVPLSTQPTMSSCPTVAASDPSPSTNDPSPSTNEEIEEAFEDTGEAIEHAANVVKETGDGGLLAAVVIVFATLLIGFAMWQHALLDPEGCSARVLKAAVGAERFRAAHEAPRSWRRCSCLIPPAPAEEEEQAQKRRGFFGLFRGGNDAREEDKRKEEEAKEARGGGLFGLFRGGKGAREEDKRKEEEAKEARGGGLFGRSRV